MKKFFGILILAIIIAFASCNQTPSVSDSADSTSISATVDTFYLDVDTTAVDTSLLK